MTTKKERRHSGRVTPKSTINAKKMDVISECLEPQECWSDWDDYRDSQRGPTDIVKGTIF